MRKKTQQEFEAEVFSLCGDEFTVVGEYQGNKIKVEIRHNICGKSRFASPQNFMRFPSCTYCSGNIKKDTEMFKEEVAKLSKGEYEFIGEYINNKTPSLFRHNSCGNEVMARPDLFVASRFKCPFCIKNTVQTTETFKYKVDKIVGNEYSVLSEYNGSHTKLQMKHNTCGNVYWVEPNHFLYSGARCPKCKNSKGERRILDYLTKLDIDFEKEYSFQNLKGLGGRLLLYDFAIFLRGQLVGLIEFDGAFHFIKTTLNNDLEKTQFHDMLKNEYADLKNIPLLRIHYKQFDLIEELIDSFLVRCGF